MLDQTTFHAEADLLDGLPVRLRAGEHSALMMVNINPGYRRAEPGNCEYRIIDIEIASTLGHFSGRMSGEIGDDWKQLLAGMSEQEVCETFSANSAFFEQLWQPCMAELAPEHEQDAPAPRR